MNQFFVPVSLNSWLQICLRAGAIGVTCALTSVAYVSAQDTKMPSGAQLVASAAEPADLRTRDSGEDWPSFLGPRRDSASRETGILTQWTDAGPPIRWQVAVGSGYGSCTTSRGRCFFFDRVDNQSRLRCFHAESGELIWTYAYRMNYVDAYGFDNGPRTSPVVDEDRVYVYGVEGELHCVSVADGKRIWMVDVSDEYGVVQNFFGVGSTPLIHENLLLTMVGGSPDGDQGLAVMELNRASSNGSAVVAFDKRTGKMVYQSMDDLASYSSLRTLKIDGRTLGVAFARENLLFFDADSGKESFKLPWRAKKLESVNAATPVIAGNRVLVTESYGPGCCQLTVSAGQPEIAWRDPPHSRDNIMASHWMTPVLAANHLYGCTDNPRKELRCIEWTTGKVIWREPTAARTSLLYVDGHLVSLEETGVMRLIAADSTKYREVAKCHLQMLGRPAWSAPVLSQGLLYVRGSEQLVCLELIPPN